VLWCEKDEGQEQKIRTKTKDGGRWEMGGLNGC
jgi:hypothetical protein